MESEIRSGDVIICGYQGSGVPWVRAIIEVLTGKSAVSSPHDCPLLEHTGIVSNNLLEPRLLSTHLSPRGLSKVGINLQVGCKVVLVLRHPKDVVTACSKSRNISLGEVLPSFFYGNGAVGSWFDFINEWEDVIKNYHGLCVHVMEYEEIVRNLPGELQKLCEFLAVPYSGSNLHTWTEKCDLDTLLTSREPPRKKMRMRMSVSEDSTMNQLNTDEIGVWKKVFTITQNEGFDEAFGGKMRNSELYAKYCNT